MKRRYERFCVINTGQVHSSTSEFYIDDIYSFFQDCYHLKDWLKNDAAVNNATKERVEDYVTSRRSLSLCADLCNSLKHLSRTRSNRSNENPSFGMKTIELTIGPKPTTASFKHQIDLQGGGSVDAFTLASECVADWETFLKNEGLL